MTRKTSYNPNSNKAPSSKPVLLEESHCRIWTSTNFPDTWHTTSSLYNWMNCTSHLTSRTSWSRFTSSTANCPALSPHLDLTCKMVFSHLNISLNLQLKKNLLTRKMKSNIVWCKSIAPSKREDRYRLVRTTPSSNWLKRIIFKS